MKHHTARRQFIIKCFILFIVFIKFILPFHANPSRSDNAETPLPSVATHFKDAYTDDLPALIKKRYIRVLTTFNKTNFYLSGATMFGFEYSLIKEYEKLLNKGIKKNDLRIVLEIIAVSRDKLIPMLNKGLGDIAAAGLTITPERLKEVDFADPYLTGINEVIVCNKNVKNLRTINDLSGRALFIRESSSYYESILSLNRTLTQKRKSPVTIIKADESLETEDILEMVNSGIIDITISDSHLAKIWSSVLNNIKVMNNLKVRTGGKIAWMVRKNNPELKAHLNKFIKNHRKGTLLGNIYFNRYYKNTKWIKNPLSQKDKKRLEYYTDLFRKYGKKYNLDWEFLMALAYHESGLKHNKKSPYGAIGIMQIKPSTASDENINIDNIEDLENNIHAGTKYLSFLRDRYFNDPSYNEKNRVRFTLAAYNAGPAKIKKAQKLASKMGLDPYSWFRNTEMAALKNIGQETVRYVSNINKYYIVYSLFLNEENLSPADH